MLENDHVSHFRVVARSFKLTLGFQLTPPGRGCCSYNRWRPDGCCSSRGRRHGSALEDAFEGAHERPADPQADSQADSQAEPPAKRPSVD